MLGVERAVRCWACGKPFGLREAYVVVELAARRVGAGGVGQPRRGPNDGQ
jgi:hypothetical protein